jgi:hypothetical protein
MMQPREAGGAAGRLMVARALDVDRVTAEVVTAFRRRGVRTILLKGPGLVRWLYDDGVPRSYVDADLLVAPGDIERAGVVLADLGFEQQPADAPHARAWIRPSDGGQVDLHGAVPGMSPPADAWRVVTHGTETMRIGPVEVEVPRIPMRALIVALHAAHHGPKAEKPLADLARAIDRAPDEIWREAATVAGRVSAIGRFAVGLRMLPEGQRVADRLRLPSTELVSQATESGSRAQIALGLDRLAEHRGVREKLRLLVTEVVPNREFMRWWSPLARRGRLGLALAYPVRILWLLWHVGPSLRAWRRSRQAASG